MKIKFWRLKLKSIMEIRFLKWKLKTQFSIFNFSKQKYFSLNPVFNKMFEIRITLNLKNKSWIDVINQSINVISIFFSVFWCWNWLFANIDCWNLCKTARVESTAMSLSKVIYVQDMTSFVQSGMTYNQISAVVTAL